MKLRAIVLALSLMALVSATVGAFAYLSLLKKSVLAETHRNMANHATIINDMVSALLTENIRAAKVLAGTEALKSVLVSKNGITLAAARRILDHFQTSLGVNVCYLMDATGLTVEATNRDGPDSFVGKNYAFRPYFNKAMTGTPWVYMARGVTSGKRGVYYSQPVYTDGQTTPAGVLVIKADIDDFERQVSETYPSDASVWALLDPHGLVFMTNKDQWVGKFFWEPDADDIREIEQTKQFGVGPWEWIGIRRTNANRVKTGDGDEHLVETENLKNKPGWRVVYMTSAESALDVISVPIMKHRIPLFIGGILLVCIVVMILHAMAQADMRRRKEVRELLDRQKTYMEALHETSLGLIGRLDFNDLIGTVLSRAGELIGTRHGFLFIHDPEKDELEMRVGLGIFKESEELRIKPGEGMTGVIFQNRSPQIISDYSRWEGRLLHGGFDELSSAMGIPIMSGASVTGVMGLGHINPQRTFSEVEIDILRRFGELASIVFDNAKLYTRLQEELTERQRAENALKLANRELKRLAVVDGLTQIANRRFFDQRLEDEWRRSARTDQPLSLLMCDVDCFKAYNDTYGHQAGDDCLRAIARTLAATVHRPGDTVARYGGEEFAIILSGTTEAGAVAVAENIREEIIRLDIPHQSSDVDHRVTVSIGVACAASAELRDGLHLQLVDASDKALYQAKTAGRNRVTAQSECEANSVV